ncbi:MAG: hypothetical protein EOP22_11300 [Hyphomicrobiales bacterium]|nr:MAG: hypothetical protein EOP22_11300 [Hyphomicrobiales bacterium]
MLRPALIALLVAAAPLPAVAAECQPAFANFLPQIVRKEAIAAIDGSYEVRLWSFCRGVPFNDSGNAGGLTRTIAANDVLVEALAARGARPDDVRFVRILDHTIDLWVHRN